MRRDTYWGQFRHLTQEKKMNKDQLLQFMIEEFESANKQAMISSGMSAQEAETKSLEFKTSIAFILSQVVDKMFEKNIF
jgi:hypothetical protein